MWPSLESEMDAFKESCYSEWYRAFRNSLPDGTGDERPRKREFLEVENSFLYLISYVIDNYQDAAYGHGGWGHGGKYPQLLTSHMLRLLTDMEVPLTAHWNSSAEAIASKDSPGNLYRSSKMLIDRCKKPKKQEDHFAMWGTDFWDDCYIVLALLKVMEKLARLDKPLANKFEANWAQSLAWLRQQVNDRFRDVDKVSGWFGPGFHAAAIELFDYLQQCGIIKDGPTLMRNIVSDVAPMVEQGIQENTCVWQDRFAWHAGQLIVVWAEKRERYPELRVIDEGMKKLYDQLKKLQREDGAWCFDREATNTNYNTVRALAACYVMEKDDANGLLASEHIRRAHNYLLAQAHQAEPFDGVVKACVNAIEAYQKLFGFTIPNIHFHLLVSLSYRLHCLGLEKIIMNPSEEDQHRLLRAVRCVVKEKLESEGEQAIEPLGVNGRLYDYLQRKDAFIAEFNDADHNTTHQKLQSFLSSTMTEVRSVHAKSLIKDLWTREGLLNFIPLIDHLSDLEHERAFYAFYRDHLNHEVLLFLLGAYIYYQHDTLRQNINDEIRSTYDHFQANPPKDLEKEFLFRWKMIATFHDIGYLFEIAPEPQRYKTATGSHDPDKEKTRMLEESFGVIETVRSNFLPEYFKQFQESNIAAIEQQLKKYLPKIKEAQDLFTLQTADELDAFNMIDEMLNTRGAARIKSGLIKNYFDLCRSKPSARRAAFFDHGVMSALILLKVADIHRFYLGQLSGKKFSKTLMDYPSFRKVLMRHASDETQERFHIRFSHVAGAIALHNIYPKLYTKEQCREFDRERGNDTLLERSFHPEDPNSEDSYTITPDKNPLAYLTALADVLQDWDRHSFRRTPYAPDDKTPIASAEVMIKCDRNGIVVTPLSDPARNRYCKHLKGIKEYMLNTDSYVRIATGQECD